MKMLLPLTPLKGTKQLHSSTETWTRWRNVAMLSEGRGDVAPLTREEARQQAQAEGLTLRVADNKTGYFGVCLDQRAGKSKPKPYQARVWRGGYTQVHLGSFATAEEAALCIARSPEGQEAAKKAAAAPPLTRTKEAQHQARDTIIRAVALDIIYEAAGRRRLS